ncbi:MAG: pentapeptide repeat-containing protein [Okeania sp. SIO3B5]|uniref:pentapeptide repeat-containing protein n=1 Tax=Okeania sp. SIO3B5 TaxID=2607811 RepID=UPI001400C3D0|nr:pentapeptide repeat-containing protein [Okeania sp. SIO3B5]NEO57860.1 pentapeptide repeat-containing protein [Okeania sp. SIO3B5]
MIKNRKQKSKNKKLEERIENLRQQGFYFPLNIQSPNKPTPEKQTRLIRRIADWWETTRVEKFLEDIEYLLKNAATLEIIGLLANLALIVSLGTWLTGLKEQRENKLFATWTIINDGKGDQSGVVKTAVERLHKDGFSLSGLQLNETNLGGVNLSEANLSEANLREANLREANLREANLREANFREANFSGANLSEANLFGADLTQANLIGADLSEAYLSEADLSEADLIFANLSEADLSEANLSEANLREANLSEANLYGVYLFGAENLSNAQIKLACNWKEAIYVNSTIVEENIVFRDKLIPLDKQANQKRIKEIEQDKDSDPKNPPDCSKWYKYLTKLY